MSEKTQIPEWLTRKEAAQRLKCSARTIDSYLASGTLRKFRLKNTARILINRDDLTNLVVQVTGV